jgi:hypothetical protein
MTYFTTFEAPDAGFGPVAVVRTACTPAGHLRAAPTGRLGHMHPNAGDTVLRIFGGELIVRVGDQRPTCREGDLVIIPPNTHHGFGSSSRSSPSTDRLSRIARGAFRPVPATARRQSAPDPGGRGRAPG